MSYRRLLLASTVLATLALAACNQPAAPSQATRPTRSDADILASIQAAGDKEESVIDVHPLRDPGVA